MERLVSYLIPLTIFTISCYLLYVSLDGWQFSITRCEQPAVPPVPDVLQINFSHVSPCRKRHIGNSSTIIKGISGSARRWQRSSDCCDREIKSFTDNIIIQRERERESSELDNRVSYFNAWFALFAKTVPAENRLVTLQTGKFTFTCNANKRARKK